MAATTPRTSARELAKWVAPPVGALVAAVSEAVEELVVERLVVRELDPELVEARVCELNVVLREMGAPVPIEAPVVTVVMVAFMDAGGKVDVPE